MQSFISFTKRPLFSFAVLASLYLFAVIFLPVNAATVNEYRFSEFEYRLVTLAIGLPLIAIWLIAFLGSKKMLDYAYTVRKTPEGKNFEQLAYGCLWLAWSIAFPLVLSNLLGSLGNAWPDLKPIAIILANYSSLILPLVAFTIIGNAAWRLLIKTKVVLNVAGLRALVLLTITIGVIYCCIAANNLLGLGLADSDNAYKLPVWLIIPTIIIPSIYMWFIGLFAVYKLSLFGGQAKGLLYKQSLRLVVAGLAAVIISLVLLQYIAGLQPRDWRLMFDYELLFVLLLRLLSGIGFALIALGAIRLKRIEDV